MKSASFDYASLKSSAAIWRTVVLGSALLSTAPAAAQTSQPDGLIADPPGEAAMSADGSLPPAFTLSAGLAAWHGDFGAPTNTDIVSVLIGARYRTGNLRLSASIPYMRIGSRGTFFSGLGGTPLFAGPNIQSVEGKQRGLGDLTLGASYLLPSTSGVDIELNGRLKVPTASDDSQLSTGKVDYSVGTELSKAFGRLTPSISATYRVFGDRSDLEFQNGFYVTTGATYALTNRSALLLSYEYAENASRFITDSHEVVLGLSVPVSANGLRLAAYASKGLSDGAADISGGASLSFAF